MPLQLDSASGAIVLTAQDGAGIAAVSVPRQGIQPYNADTPTTQATLSDILAGTITTPESMSPQTVKQAITSLAPSPFPTVVNSNTTLSANANYIVVSGTSLSLTLPASPSVDQQINLIDGGCVSGSVRPTLLRNGNTIQGLAQDFVVDIPGFLVTLNYDGTTWQLI